VTNGAILSRCFVNSIRNILLPTTVFFWCAFAGAAQPPARDQQINDLQKQIDALNRKLDELKRTPPPAPPAKPSGPPEGTLDPAWVKALTWRRL
jgi:hypothetical protein